MKKLKKSLVLFLVVVAITSNSQQVFTDNHLLDLRKLTINEVPFQGLVNIDLDTSLNKPKGITNYGWLEYSDYVVQFTDTSNYSIVEFSFFNDSKLQYGLECINSELTISELISIFAIAPVKVGDDFVEIACLDSFYKEFGFSLVNARFTWENNKLSYFHLFTAC